MAPYRLRNIIATRSARRHSANCGYLSRLLSILSHRNEISLSAKCALVAGIHDRRLTELPSEDEPLESRRMRKLRRGRLFHEHRNVGAGCR
jgi:hypothetical protein